MKASAVIFGVRGPSVDLELKAFFAATRPFGFILFQEACRGPDQVRRLVSDLHEAVGWEAPVFIDQEGGRVARLKSPAWPSFPAAASYAEIFARDPYKGREAASIGHRLIAHELYSMGIRANCAPCVDLPVAGADPVIGDRAFGRDPQTIVTLARAALEGLADGGVLGVLKHIPGHGRAEVDSHKRLPRVDADRASLAQDFAPFRALARQAKMAMTAHVVFEAIDDARPATTSPTVVDDIIRKEIGFDGLLISDDIAMNALQGDWWERTERSLWAGCDVVLHCTGVLEDMQKVAAAAPYLSGRALDRAKAAMATMKPPREFDVDEGWEKLNSLLREFRAAA
jgi:beta-N-acetylhexosaminidase